MTPNVQSKTIKLSEGNIGFGNNFLDMTPPKAHATKAKLNKLATKFKKRLCIERNHQQSEKAMYRMGKKLS